MRTLLLAMVLVCCARSHAEFAARISRDCTVFLQADTSSGPVCRLQAGMELNSAEHAPQAGFLRIQTRKCSGYVTDSCVEFPKTGSETPLSSPVVPIVERRSSAKTASSLSVLGAFDLVRATVPYNSLWTKGIGLSGKVQWQFRFGQDFRLSLASGYSRLSLSRVIDGSGALEDPTPSEFSQTLTYWSNQLLFGYETANQKPFVGSSRRRQSYWLEAGAEFAIPLGASQTRGTAAAQSFTNTEKLLLALLGGSFALPVGERWNLETRMLAFYNLASSSSGHFFGLRLDVAFGLEL